MKIFMLIFMCAIVVFSTIGCNSSYERFDTEIQEGWWRENYNGHSYVVRGGAGQGSGISHDPDCKCLRFSKGRL